MKQFYCLVILFVFSYITAIGQVGVNSENSIPDNSAMLDVKSTNKGFLPPRMTFAELNAIVNPVSGLTVYCKDCGQGGSGALSVFINGIWNTIGTTCLNPVSPVAGVHVSSLTQIVWKWNTAPLCLPLFLLRPEYYRQP